MRCYKWVIDHGRQKCKLCPSWRYGSRPLRGTLCDALGSSEPSGVPLRARGSGDMGSTSSHRLRAAQGAQSHAEPHRAAQNLLQMMLGLSGRSNGYRAIVAVARNTEVVSITILCLDWRYFFMLELIEEEYTGSVQYLQYFTAGFSVSFAVQQ